MILSKVTKKLTQCQKPLVSAPFNDQGDSHCLTSVTIVDEKRSRVTTHTICKLRMSKDFVTLRYMIGYQFHKNILK